ncbi:MAG: TIGR01777 family oxidoreductase [Bacteroidales bacterium]|nr:TIGR01777 family oxidoreductase [Bacteroidales bacterium]
MKTVLIVGGTGFIGRNVADYFNSKGYIVSILSRKIFPNHPFRMYEWDPLKYSIQIEALTNQDVIINLSGAGIADKYWTSKRKKVLYDSRIDSTRFLIDTLIRDKIFPEMFIHASAIGFYGNRPHERLYETSDKGESFLSTLCQAWENEVRRLDHTNIKYAILRIGIVLSKKEGSFPKVLFPLKKGFTILFGKGLQHISWIHLKDLIKIIESLSGRILKPGIYNCVAPQPVKQKDLNDQLKRTLHIKTLKIRIPKKLISLIAGDMTELFYSDQYVVPENLQHQNFEFAFPDLHSALKNLVPPM